jgi:hypothetical protein
MTDQCPATTIVSVALHGDARVQCEQERGHAGNHWAPDQDSGFDDWRVSATWPQETIDYGARGGQPFGYA